MHERRRRKLQSSFRYVARGERCFQAIAVVNRRSLRQCYTQGVLLEEHRFGKAARAMHKRRRWNGPELQAPRRSTQVYRRGRGRGKRGSGGWGIGGCRQRTPCGGVETAGRDGRKGRDGHRRVQRLELPKKKIIHLSTHKYKQLKVHLSAEDSFIAVSTSVVDHTRYSI